MRGTIAIAAIGLAGLALGACRQEPTAEPVDNETEVTARTGAAPEPAPMPTEGTATPDPDATETPAAAQTATAEASATPTP